MTQTAMMNSRLDLRVSARATALAANAGEYLGGFQKRRQRAEHSPAQKIHPIIHLAHRRAHVPGHTRVPWSCYGPIGESRETMGESPMETYGGGWKNTGDSPLEPE